MTKKRILTTSVVVALLAALVYLQVEHWRSFDWARFRAASHVHPLQIAIAVGLVYLTYLLRAARWKVFLEPVCQARAVHLIPPTFIGFAGLALLGRPGEFIRPYLIAKKEDVTVSSQIGVWTVERIFDTGAFAVLMAIAVFFSSQIKANPYASKFQLAAIALCGLVAFMALAAVMIRRRGPQVARFLHGVTSKISARLAHHVDQKVRAFGEGLNTVAGPKSFAKLVALSLVIWFLIALAYREVAHSYPPDPGTQVTEQGPPAVDVDTAKLADLPELAGQPLGPDTVEALEPALQAKGYSLKEQKGDLWLFHKNKRIKKVGDHPHLSNMDVAHVLLLMGFSMIGSVAQLPAVGGGSQLAVISALQLIYGIPPEAAVSCGILLWLVTFMACIPVGLFFAHRGHLSLRKLSAESHQEEEREEEQAEPLFAAANPYPLPKSSADKPDSERPHNPRQEPQPRRPHQS
ncbi:MAG TPA: lysylphosphatidylglycerol synthase transmembrane domain-containing protein [Terriglobales bacterium]|nr:lysylphosphatidylglycerol synthase transmembrane domain-containing protein [Terriglobales bacterium]